MSIQVITADITQLGVDAIVNAANTTLLGGGGVDGAIHRTAGPELLDACRSLPQVEPGVRCPTGEARITPGFRLPARYVIHTVGPVWRGGDRGEPALLASCYRQSMALAFAHGVKSIAFPAISCGIYGYPPELAAPLALQSLGEVLLDRSVQVQVCCFSDAMAEVWRTALNGGR
ncbi:MAG TPA: O-acetyl-ADP-ribose deacetylase [Dyella sp.]|uniref:O-acetyl-ADP-ribose deacetylase n=1 Tax=Dyella sp. TaxID=1869338 RepID=UPI002D786BF5|nr:O-acetyl-ADP-ribose deacetylase [Dyella sp.]HET6553692.1 O-acetyl-ADP-ribose deacetylase [Dyella sp.]